MTEITTVEELDALPDRAIVRIGGSSGAAALKFDGLWIVTGFDGPLESDTLATVREHVTLTVLWPRPDAPAPSTEDRDPRAFEHTPEAAEFGAEIEQAAIDSGVGWDEVHPIELACRLMAAGYSLAARQPAPVDAESGPWQHDGHRPVQHRDGKPPWCNACGWSSPLPAIPARKVGAPRG